MESHDRKGADQDMRYKHKFSAKKTESDGIKFDSKLEAKYYEHLKLLKRAGEVLFFLRQVPFHLVGGIVYRADFQVFYSDGYIEFVDVKGMETPEFIAKKKQVEATYPVEIKIVKKGDF